MPFVDLAVVVVVSVEFRAQNPSFLVAGRGTKKWELLRSSKQTVYRTGIYT